MSLSHQHWWLSTRLQDAIRNDPPLRPGERGVAVQLLQEAFVKLGYAMPRSTKPSGELDGIYGREVMARVRQLEIEKGLDRDRGIAGKQVLGKVDELLKLEFPPSSEPAPPPPPPPESPVTFASVIAEYIGPSLPDVEPGQTIEDQVAKWNGHFSEARMVVAAVNEWVVEWIAAQWSTAAVASRAARLSRGLGWGFLSVSILTIPLQLWQVGYADLQGPKTWGFAHGVAHHLTHNAGNLSRTPLSKPIDELPRIVYPAVQGEPARPVGDPADIRAYLVKNAGGEKMKRRIAEFSDSDLEKGFYPNFKEGVLQADVNLRDLERRKKGRAHALLWTLGRQYEKVLGSTGMRMQIADDVFWSIWGSKVSQAGK